MTDAINLGSPPNMHPANGAMERIGSEMDAILNGEVAFDGLTGEPIRATVDGAEAEVRFGEQAPLIEVSVVELIHQLVKASDAVKAAKKAKKAASGHLKDAQDRLAEIADALCERDQPTQAELGFEDEEA